MTDIGQDEKLLIYQIISTQSGYGLIAVNWRSAHNEPTTNKKLPLHNRNHKYFITIMEIGKFIHFV